MNDDQYSVPWTLPTVRKTQARSDGSVERALIEHAGERDLRRQRARCP